MLPFLLDKYYKILSTVFDLCLNCFYLTLFLFSSLMFLLNSFFFSPSMFLYRTYSTYFLNRTTTWQFSLSRKTLGNRNMNMNMNTNMYGMRNHTRLHALLSYSLIIVSYYLILICSFHKLFFLNFFVSYCLLSYSNSYFQFLVSLLLDRKFFCCSFLHH